MTRTALAAAAAFLLALGSPAFAQTIEDPLHGFCWGTSSCTDNGTVTPTTSVSPQFGFASSDTVGTGDFLVLVLVPDNVTGGGSVSGMQISGGATSPANANKVDTEWSSGTLDAFLAANNAPAGIDSSPSNPLSAFLTPTQTVDPGANGYFVYEADLGVNQLSTTSATTPVPELTINANLPKGAMLTGFLNYPSSNGQGAKPWIATAPSGNIMVTGDNNIICIPGVNCNQQEVPEPTDLSVLAVGLLGLGVLARRRRSRG